MGLRIGTNIASMTARRHLGLALGEVHKSFARLATGRRLPSDDPAGVAISARMRAELRSLDRSIRNGQDGISLLQVAEGGLGEITDGLIRMRELSVQAANGTLSPSDRDTLQLEFAQLIESVGQIAATTEFNGIQLLTGSGAAVNLQVGPDTTSSDVVNVSLVNATTTALGIAALNIGGAGDASGAMQALDTALQSVSDARGLLGAQQSGLEARLRALAVRSENLAAAESRIMDVDVARETADLVKHQITSQAAMAVLAQANLQPRLALRLIESASLAGG